MTEPRYYVNVIKIRASDSPNVKLGLLQQARGLQPTGELLLEGVLSWQEYCKRRATMDEQEQCVSLDAEFWEGKEAMLFPGSVLARAEQFTLKRCKYQKRRWMGVDSAEGGDNTAWCIIDKYGIVDMLSIKTPDTTKVVDVTRAKMREHDVAPEDVLFDRGGGGKQHADRLRQDGFDVRTIGFGEGVSQEHEHWEDLSRENKESRYQFVNRRAQLYGEAAYMLAEQEFALPAKYGAVRDQLAPIPKLLNGEGRLYLPPKRRSKKTERSLVDIIGHSPDEADAYVLSVHGMLHESEVFVAGPIL